MALFHVLPQGRSLIHKIYVLFVLCAPGQHLGGFHASEQALPTKLNMQLS
jgi:hypothetical protein